MPIKFLCPHCKKGLTAKDEQSGKKVACPACKKPLIIPRAAAAVPTAAAPPARPQKTAVPAKAVKPEDLEAAVADMLSDRPAGKPSQPTSIDFTCEYCDAAVSVPVADAGKRVPCPACSRILKVPAAAKADPSNWRKADTHLPSAAKAPDQPAPEGAWGTLTRTVVSREALEDADAIAEKPEPVPLRQRVAYWTRLVVACAAVIALVLYVYNRFSVRQERESATLAVDYARRDDTKRQIGPERLGALHTLAGCYYLRTRVPYSDAPGAAERGAGEQGREEFELALKSLQDAKAGSAERDAALGDLALAMVELGGDKDEQREKVRTTWEICLHRVRAALGSIHSPEAKLEAYREVAARLCRRGQTEAARALASTAFSESPAQRAAARAVVLLLLLDDPNCDKTMIANACEEMLKEYAVKDPPPLAAELVTLAVVLGKTPPATGKLVEDEENAWIGQAEGMARAGQLPAGRQKAQTAATPRVKLRSLVAIGSATKQGVEDLGAACKFALEGLPEPGREGWVLLRLARLGVRAGVPEELLRSMVNKIDDPAIRGRAHLELLRGRLEQARETVGTDVADTVDPQTPAGALARADLARHNIRYDSGYFRIAKSWPDPLWAFGTLGALLGTQRDGD